MAVETWRYLRLSIVGVVIGLGVSILVEFSRSRHLSGASGHCWLGSISAYYYTPVHAVFVGAMVTIGVCLVCIRGNTDLEDVLLNLAGMLAPIVALVPTANVPDPKQDCWSSITDKANRELNISNNLIALLVAGLLAFLLLATLAVMRKLKRSASAERPLSTISIAGFGVAGALYLAVVGLFWWDRPWFSHNAHNVSAITMFGFVTVNVLLNGYNLYHARKGIPNKAVRPLNRYMSTGIVMVLAAILIPTAGHSLHVKVFLLEATMIGLFAFFWILQTVELWPGGLRRHAIERLKAGV